MSRRRMRGFKEFTPVRDAIRKVKGLVRRLGPGDVEEVPLEDSLGRIAASDVRSPIDVPGYDRSAVDGFAVRSRDVLGASPTNPLRLRVVGTLKAGDPPPSRGVGEGECYEIYTGAPLPPGADAVVMVEHVKRLGDHIEVFKPVPPLGNVSRRGEDFKRGDLILKAGQRIRPWHIGALASLNIARVGVYRRLRVGVLSTGDELIEVGGELRPGKIVDSTKPMLKSMLREDGWVPVDLGIAGDSLVEISERIARALSKLDALIVTGGSSVGAFDFVPEAVARVASPGIVVHGVALRPGRTAGVAVHDGKPIFMMSGFPVAAVAGYDSLVRPILGYISHLRDGAGPVVRARLERRVAKPVGFRSYVRVLVRRVDGEYVAQPLRLTGSGILSTMIRGNGLLIVPEELEGHDEGEVVEVVLIGKVGGDEEDIS